MDKILLLLLIISSALAKPLDSSQAQTEPSTVQIHWTIDAAPEGGWTIGDRIPLRLTVSYPLGYVVTLPRLPASWGPFEVRSQENLDPSEDQDGTRTAIEQIVITPWVPGSLELPPLVIQYRDQQGNLHKTAAPSQTIPVASVLVDGETDKAELKPQATLPVPSRLPYLLGVLIILGLCGALSSIGFRYLRRRSRAAPDPGLSVDPRPPHEVAYGELERIAGLDLPAHAEFKMHYSLVADCVRNYVDGRYHIPAMDLTTPELDVALRRRQLEPPHIALIYELLAQADLVKFAKYRPHIEEAYGTIAAARSIVELTTPAGPAVLNGEAETVTDTSEREQIDGVRQDAGASSAQRQRQDR